MLMGALGIFTLVAAMGALMVCDVWRGRGVEPMYALLHGGTALLGSALVIVAALMGDARLYANIGLAVVIIVLGVVMGLYGKRGKRVPKVIIVTHAGLAIGCYALLAFFTLFPNASLAI
jgi:hypothetical protein